MLQKSWRKSPLVLLVVILLLVVGSCGAESKIAAKQPAAPQAPADQPLRILKISNPLPTPKGEPKTITPKGITLHWWSFESNANIQTLRKVLRKNTEGCGINGCSVQFAVTEDGKVYQMMKSPTSFARHASGANDTTIGIEIEGTSEQFALKGKNFNKKKFEAVISLTTHLVKIYRIPIDGKVRCDDVTGIHGHHEYNFCRDNGTEKPDPGDAYTKAVKARVKGML